MHNQLQKDQYLEKRFRFDPGKGAVKDVDEDEETGRTQIRMPVSSTAEDRDGDEFSRDGLEDMKEQIDSGRVPMMLDHGRGGDGPYYGTLGIVGRWDSAEIESEGDIDVLYATGTPASTEPAEKMTQLIDDDMPVGSSVGFRILEYERDEEENKYRFHGVDLLEISQVGIPSNPVTVNAGDDVGIQARGALGSPASPQRGYAGAYNQIAARGGQPQGHVPAPNAAPRTSTGQAGHPPVGVDELREHFDDRIEALEDRLTDAGDADTNSSDMKDDPDGGDDPADGTSSTDDVDELRQDVSELTETVGDLADATNTLIESLDEGRSATPDETDANGDDSGDDPGSDARSDPGEDAVQLFLGDDANEDVRKEFEALQERANDDGELDLAKSETRLFGDDEDGASNDATDSDDNEVRI